MKYLCRHQSHGIKLLVTLALPGDRHRDETTPAHRLRQAWLEAKRDDVPLTAQDFASDLVDEPLVRRRRRPAVQN
jgi:hypothetical protein